MYRHLSPGDRDGGTRNCKHPIARSRLEPAARGIDGRERLHAMRQRLGAWRLVV